MAVRTLAELPGLAGVYAKVLGGGLPIVGPALTGGGERDLPTLRVEGVPIDRSRLEAYRRVCGFGVGDGLPATYPQVVAFPLILELMTHPAFPFAALGTLHIGNSIVARRALTAAQPLALDVSAGHARPHPRGRRVDVAVAARVGDEDVWRARMSLLRREQTSSPTGSNEGPTEGASEGGDAARDRLDVPDEAPRGPQVWRLPGDLGRRYASVSGDRNPIHLADLTAKPFGFSRHIAHGMWTHARALAAIENRLPDALRVDVAFKKPITLPGSVEFGAREVGDGLDFGVSSRDGAPHLLGRVRPL